MLIMYKICRQPWEMAMLIEDDVKSGCLYRGLDGLDKFVISVKPAKGRFRARVFWRRPGRHAHRVMEDTIQTFIKFTERKLDDLTSVEPAPDLFNNGMPC